MKDIIPLAKGLYPKGDIVSIPDNVIGVHLWSQNRVASTDMKKLLFTSLYPTGFNKFYVNEANFEKIDCINSVRWLSEGNWMNRDDEFMIPDESNQKFKQFKFDSIIYSLFSLGNYCTSTDHDYAGRHWDINNEFFWMGNDELKALAVENCNDEVYKDAGTDSERYVYKYIQSHKDEFSPDAWKVYERACDIVRESFKYRNIYNDHHPEIQVNHWDAGWYQIKYILKEYLPDELKSFRSQFKLFESRLRPLVYELGFLPYK